MGIAVVLSGWLGYFTETGVNSDLIRKREDIRPYLDTAWTIQILRSFGFAAILVVGAPLGARFFDSPEATPIIRAIALVAVLWSFTNPAVVYLRKELDFRREVRWRLCGVATGLVVAIPMAFVLGNVWALLLSAVSAQAAETVASYWIKPYRPRFRLDLSRARELMRFGKWVFLLSIATFLFFNADSLVVGKMLGVTTLGLYQMANRLAMLMTSQIGIYIDGLMFPAFSKLQEGRDLRRAFLRTLALTSLLVIPLGCFLGMFARPLVQVILGARWLSISATLQILAWAGVARAIMGTTKPLFLSVGKPNLAVRASFLGLVLLGLFIYPLAFTLGMTGVALAVLISALLSTGYHLLVAARLLGLTALEIGATFKLGAVGSLPLLGAGFLAPSSLTPSLFIAVRLGVGAYLLILLKVLRSDLDIGPGLWLSHQPQAQL